MKLMRVLIGASAISALSMLPTAFSNAMTLQQVVTHTLRTNPDVLLDADIRNAAKEAVRAAVAGYLPTVNITAAIGRAETKLPGSPYVTLTRREAGVVLNQMVFDGFFTANNVARTKALTNADAYRAWGTADNTALLATEAYLNVIRNRRIVNAAYRNVKAHVRTLRIVRQRSDSGLARRAEISVSLSRLALARSNYLAAKNDLRDARITFAQIVGYMPRNLTMPRRVARAALPINVRTAVQRTVNENPFVRSASADIAEAEAQYRTTESPFMPRLDVALSANSDYNVNGVRGSNNDLAAMLQLSYNLYNGGADVASQNEAAYQVEQAKDIKDRTIREAIQRTCLAWADYSTSIGRLPQLTTYRRQSVKTVTAYREQFKLGKRTALDLLDAEGESFNAQVAYINESFDNQIARYRILNSIGVLVPYLRVALPQEAAIPYYEWYNNNRWLTQVGGRVPAGELPALQTKAAPSSLMYDTHPDYSPVRQTSGYSGKSRYAFKHYSYQTAVNEQQGYNQNLNQNTTEPHGPAVASYGRHSQQMVNMPNQSMMAPTRTQPTTRSQTRSTIPMGKYTRTSANTTRQNYRQYAAQETQQGTARGRQAAYQGGQQYQGEPQYNNVPQNPVNNTIKNNGMGHTPTQPAQTQRPAKTLPIPNM